MGKLKINWEINREKEEGEGEVSNINEKNEDKESKEINENEIVKIGENTYIYKGVKLIFPGLKSDKHECEYADIFFFGNKIEDASVLADHSSFWTKGEDDGQLKGEAFPEKKFKRDSDEDMLEFFSFYEKEYKKYYRGSVSKTRHGETTESHLRNREKMKLPEKSSRDYYANAEVACHTIFEKFLQLRYGYDPDNEAKLVEKIYREMKDSLKNQKYEEVVKQEEEANILIEKIIGISTEIEDALKQEKYSRCPGCGESLEFEKKHTCSYEGQMWFEKKYPDLPPGYMDRTDQLSIGEKYELLIEVGRSDLRGEEYSICVKLEERE